MKKLLIILILLTNPAQAITLYNGVDEPFAYLINDTLYDLDYKIVGYKDGLKIRNIKGEVEFFILQDLIVHVRKRIIGYTK